MWVDATLVLQALIALLALANTLASYLVHRKVGVVAHEINSVKDELVAATAKASFAEGRAESAARPQLGVGS